MFLPERSDFSSSKRMYWTSSHRLGPIDSIGAVRLLGPNKGANRSVSHVVVKQTSPFVEPTRMISVGQLEANDVEVMAEFVTERAQKCAI